MLRYEDILEIIKGKNVELRHDVDISLIAAYNMAETEYRNKVKSTYYIRTDCDYYNPFSIESQKMLKKMDEWGHEIGVHVDINNKDSFGPLQQFLSTRGIIFNTNKFTFHKNSEETKKYPEKVGFYLNKSIVGKYVSDSRDSFDEEKLKFIKEEDNYTLLIHPEWWEYSGTSEDKIRKAIKEMEV